MPQPKNQWQTSMLMKMLTDVIHWGNLVPSMEVCRPARFSSFLMYIRVETRILVLNRKTLAPPAMAMMLLSL